MNGDELREEAGIEMAAIEQTLSELASLCRDVAGREPTVREVAAGGLFLANFYGGIENALKRVAAHHGYRIPAGPDWHVELSRAFGDPPQAGLPALLDRQLSADLAPFRRFRHVVYHAYGHQLKWEEMLPGIEQAADVFLRFRSGLEAYLRSLE